MSDIDPICLPWQTKHDFDVEGYTTIIGNVDGEIIEGTTHHTFDFVARTLDEDDDSQSWSIAAANARFIVRACNAHYEMLEALGDLLTELKWVNEQLDLMPDEYAEAQRKAAAAVAKARGAA